MSTPPFLRPKRKAPLFLKLKHGLPRSLFGRTLLIIVLPTLITLAAATFVFFDRHWATETDRLTYAVAGDVAVIVEQIRHAPTPEAEAAMVRLAAEKMEIYVSFSADAQVPAVTHDGLNPLRNILRHALKERLDYPFEVDMRSASGMISIQVGVPEGVYTLRVPERRIYTPTTEVFIAWMVGSSLLLSAIALLFMRNQLRPIRRLADAAEAIGKGQGVPWFKLEGASEVRQAGATLMVMRDRLTRQITQRTTMLAGVSHDLRTPLTRMKLQLEMMPESDDKKELVADIAEMDVMVEAYLAFARGEEAESVAHVDLAALLGEVVAAARRQNPAIALDVPEGLTVKLRRLAIKRCLSNLVGNAIRYGKTARVAAQMADQSVTITIDDDGPGIAPEKREDVFRPFVRVEESRNPTTGGVGLGLTIARDIARAHGGDVVLEESPMGGLRARVWLPA